MTHLIRSAYLDTNVYAAAATAGPLWASSERVVGLAKARRFGAVGSVLLRRELQGLCAGVQTRAPLRLYEESILLEMPPNRAVKHLGRLYLAELKIKPNDALHLGYAVVVGVDIFVSWNREDLVKQKTRVGLRQINDRLGRKSPIILTPATLIDRTNAKDRRGRLSLR